MPKKNYSSKERSFGRKVSDTVSSIGLSVALQRPVKVKNGVTSGIASTVPTKKVRTPSSFVDKMNKPFPGGRNAGQMVVKGIKDKIQKRKEKKFVPFYGTYGGRMSNGTGWGGELPSNVKMKK